MRIIRLDFEIFQSSFQIKYICYTAFGGTRWRSWLRLYAKSRKVAGSIPEGVIGIFD